MRSTVSTFRRVCVRRHPFCKYKKSFLLLNVVAVYTPSIDACAAREGRLPCPGPPRWQVNHTPCGDTHKHVCLPSALFPRSPMAHARPRPSFDSRTPQANVLRLTPTATLRIISGKQCSPCLSGTAVDSFPSPRNCCHTRLPTRPRFRITPGRPARFMHGLVRICQAHATGLTRHNRGPLQIERWKFASRSRWQSSPPGAHKTSTHTKCSARSPNHHFLSAEPRGGRT